MLCKCGRVKTMKKSYLLVLVHWHQYGMAGCHGHLEKPGMGMAIVVIHWEAGGGSGHCHCHCQHAGAGVVVAIIVPE